jgi:DNA polymerase III epsilon subunit-like protein
MIVIDTETTDLLKPSAVNLNDQPHMIEICLISYNDKMERTGELNTFIKPPISIPPMITKITGIDDSMVRDSQRFIYQYDAIVARIKIISK